MIERGSIVEIQCEIYCEFESEKWSTHFATIRKKVLIKSAVSNNGFFTAVDSNGKTYYHLNRNDVTRVIKRGAIA